MRWNSVRLKSMVVSVLALLALTGQHGYGAVCGTPGADGAGPPSGIINTYYPGAASVSAGSTSIPVGAPQGAGTAIAAGDLLLVIQMQDADINFTNNSNYGANAGNGSGYTALNNTGRYEYVRATGSVVAGSVPILGSGGGGGLVYSYRSRPASTTNGQSTYQVIRVPQYSTTTISGTVSALAWNGTVGGVVAFDAAGAVIINGTVEANGKGFRGGWGEVAGAGAGANTNYISLSTSNANGMKGEGIVGTPQRMNQPAALNAAPALSATGTSLGYPDGANTTASKSRGAPGNAGGGGQDGNAANDQNSGGGGGGNYGSGGKGGNSWNSNMNAGGEGGSFIAGLAFNRVVMGGGGGAGTTNNSTADNTTYANPAGNACSTADGRCSSGAPGGGIVIIRALSLSGGGTISVRGGTAYNVQNDSSGGGGAGGSVVLETKLGGVVTVDASGGDGGNAWRSSAGGAANRHGPGGGGSGGFVAYAPSAMLVLGSIAGGINGKSTTLNDDYGSTGSYGGYMTFQSPNAPGPKPGHSCVPQLAVSKTTTTPVISALPGSATYQISVTNASGTSTARSVTITDTLPGAPSLFTNASASPTVTYFPNAAPCNTSRTAVTNAAVGTSVPSWSSWDIPENCTVTLAFNATVPAGTVPAVYQNPVTVSYLDPAGTGGARTAVIYDPTTSTAEDVRVMAPPSASKAFGASSIAAGGNTTVVVTLSNPNSAALTGVAFTDTLPTTAAGAPGEMTILNPPAPSTTCSGTPAYTAVNGSGSFSVSGLTIPASSSCTATFTVTAPETGIYVNTIPAGAVTSSAGENTNPASASLTAGAGLLPPTIAKTFLTNPVLVNGVTTLRFTLTNPNASTAIGSVGFIDTLPAAIVVAPAPNVTNTCGGTFAAAAGSNYLSLNTDGTIPANSSCQITIDVTSSVGGVYQNTTAQVVGDTGAGNRASDTLVVMAPLVIAKSFSVNPVQRSTATVLTITLTNPNSVAVTGVSFTDLYPLGLVNTASPSAATTCGGAPTITAAAGGSSLAVGGSGAMIPADSSCTITVNVEAAANGSYSNSTGPVTTTNAGTAAAATRVLTVLAPPSAVKSFSPALIPQGGQSGMTITIGNPASNPVALTGVDLTDTYTGTLVNATAGAVICTDGSSATLTGGVNGGTNVGIAGGTILPGGSCAISQLVSAGASPNAKSNTNTTSAPTSANGGSGTPATAYLKVIQPLVVSKTFSNPEPAAATTDVTMTISMYNPNPDVSVINATFTDTYPAGLTNHPSAPAASLTNATTCGSPAAITGGAAGGSNVGVKNAIIPPLSTCTLSIIVRDGMDNAVLTNSVTVTTDNAGSSSDSATISRGTGAARVYFTKSFAPNPINVNGTSTLTFTVYNPHTAGINNITFVDTLPAGVTATNGTQNNVCGAGSSLVVSGGTTITLTSGLLGAAAAGPPIVPTSCTFSVTTITSSIPGTYLNVTGAISASSGAGTPAEASLVVRYLPTISKEFGADSLAPSGTTTLTFFIGNENSSTIITSAVFTDTLPTSPGAMTISNATVSNNTCGFTPQDQGGGALGAGDTGVRIPNGSSIPAGGCRFSVNITAALPGVYTNTIPAGALQTNAGNSPAPSTVQLTVPPLPPTLSKTFVPSSVSAGSPATLIVTLANPNAVPVPLTSVFTDTFPAGVLTAATPNRATTCYTVSGTLAPVGGTASTLTLASGAVIPAGNQANPGVCLVQADVMAAAVGFYTNTLAAGSLQTTAGSNSAAASAVLTVVPNSPPSVSKAFGTTVIGVGRTTTLTLTFSNTNTGPAILSANFDDNLPADLVIASPNGLTGTCALGSVTAIQSTGLIRYASGAAIPSGGCTIVVNVTSAAPNTYTNTVAAGALQANLGNSPGSTSASLTVSQALLNKAFSPTTIDQSGTSTLTFTLTNGTGNPVQSGINFTDTLPTNVTVAGTPNITSTCPSGTGVVTAAAGAGVITVTGASMSSGQASCVITVDVTSNTPGGPYNNTSGNISGASRITNSVTSSGLTVQAKPTLTKAFGPSTIGTGQTSTLTFTIANPAGAPARSDLTFTDTLPANVVIAAVPNVVNNCGGTPTITASAGSGSLTVGGSGVNAASGASSCTISIDVTSDTAGSYINGAGQITSISALLINGVTDQTLTVNARPTATKTFAPNTMAPGATSTITITLNNSNAVAITGAAFTDTYPANLVNATPVNGATTCGGVVTAANGGGSVALSGGTIPAGGSCTVTVEVTSGAPGSYMNTIPAGGITTTNAGSNTSDISGSLTVSNLIAPAVTKSISPSPIAPSGVTTLSVAIANTNTVAMTGVTVTDTYPAGVTTAAVPNITQSNCGVVPTSAAGSVTLTNGTIPAGLTCTFTIDITSSTPGTVTNTIPIGGVTTTNAGSNTAAASADLMVLSSLAAIKSFSPPSMGVADTSVLTITLTNSNSIDITGVSFNDSYPANLVSTSSASAQASPAGCTGTLTALNNGTSLSLNGGTVPAGFTCTYTVNVTSMAAGVYDNSTGNIATTEAGTTSPATATLVVASMIEVSGYVYNDLNHSSGRDGSESGTGMALFVKLAPRSGATCSGPALAAASADAVTGAYSLSGVVAGDYCLILDSNNALDDIVPSYPSGWVGTEMPGGVRHVSLAIPGLTLQNFGLFGGSTISGRVFRDDGSSGGAANDGVQNGGEAGIANVAVMLTDQTDAVVYESVLTDGSGSFVLHIPSSLTTGTVLKIIETNPGGHISTGGGVGTTGGSYDRATDTLSFSLTAGSSYGGVAFGDVPANQLLTDGNQTVLPGATVFYPHTFMAGSEGSVQFSTAAAPVPGIPGWSEVLYLDTDCNGTLDAGEPQITSAQAVAAGQQLCILVKEFVPANAPFNAQNSISVTAQFTYTGAIPALASSQTRSDITTVGQATAAGLVLVKTVDKTSALPGEAITYTITYTNAGNGPLGNIVIHDSVPAFTMTPSACCVNPGSACLGSAAAPFPQDISACFATISGNSIEWMLTGTLVPGGAGQVKFRVTVQP